MPPDLNSLPPSRSSSGSPLQTRMAQPTSTSTTEAFRNHSPSPPVSHSPPHSLAAAAALNAGIQNEESRRPSIGSMRRDVEHARRRSSIRMNLNFNDPTLPAPGELQMSPSVRTHTPTLSGSPHHERTQSLGELHQELESEQEAQVNRLLSMIRQQQAQITTLQTNNTPPSHIPSSSAVIDDGTPTSERSLSLPQAAYTPQQNMAQLPPLSTNNVAMPRSRSPLPNYGNLSRHSSTRDRSRGSSRAGSPAMRPVSGVLGSSYSESNEWLLGAPAGTTRDESAFYQAETQMLTRENQMLKLRIRELERQLSDLNPTSPITHTPVFASNLASSPPVSRQDTLTPDAHDTNMDG